MFVRDRQAGTTTLVSRADGATGVGADADSTGPTISADGRHVAFASTMDDHEAWGERVARGGARPTPVIDRFYFRSIYFREPSGVLFEIADDGPGFTVDGYSVEELGSTIILPPQLEPQRERIEAILTPLPDPRALRSPAR